MQYMNGVLLARTKEVRDEGTIVEIVIWEVPEPLSPCVHRYKYRLFYGPPGQERVRYDNASEARAITDTFPVLRASIGSAPSSSCSRISSTMWPSGVRHEGSH